MIQIFPNFPLKVFVTVDVLPTSIFAGAIGNNSIINNNSSNSNNNN